jgi:hypothetical protein
MEDLEFFLRGIKHPSQIEEGIPKTENFLFEEKDRDEKKDFVHSINWLIGDAIAYTLEMKKPSDPNEYLFKGGVARMESSVINLINSNHLCKGKLSCDHKLDPNIPDNIYHGNLVLKGDVPKYIRTFIANWMIQGFCEIHSK